jgi:hypothetical protein
MQSFAKKRDAPSFPELVRSANHLRSPLPPRQLPEDPLESAASSPPPSASSARPPPVAAYAGRAALALWRRAERSAPSLGGDESRAARVSGPVGQGERGKVESVRAVRYRDEGGCKRDNSRERKVRTSRSFSSASLSFLLSSASLSNVASSTFHIAI